MNWIKCNCCGQTCYVYGICRCGHTSEGNGTHYDGSEFDETDIRIAWPLASGNPPNFIKYNNNCYPLSTTIDSSPPATGCASGLVSGWEIMTPNGPGGSFGRYHFPQYIQITVSNFTYCSDCYDNTPVNTQSDQVTTITVPDGVYTAENLFYNEDDSLESCDARYNASAGFVRVATYTGTGCLGAELSASSGAFGFEITLQRNENCQIGITRMRLTGAGTSFPAFDPSGCVFPDFPCGNQYVSEILPTSTIHLQNCVIPGTCGFGAKDYQCDIDVDFM